MFVFDLLPSWIFTLLTVVALGAFLVTEFLGNIPFVATYLKAIRLASIVGLVVGLYMMGGAANQEKWESRVKELESKVILAEQKSKTANAELDSNIKDKKQLIKEQQNSIQSQISKVTEKINAECKVPKEAIDILNKAAVGPK